MHCLLKAVNMHFSFPLLIVHKSIQYKTIKFVLFYCRFAMKGRFFLPFLL